MAKSVAVAGMMALAAPARAECLGQGCYDGFATFFLGVFVAAIVVLALVIWGLVALARRWRR
ncbi:MAG: hypothetical protein HC844_10600 [Tabrizicola sp.]|nr:hypothetical protein [Tabrizicola sp.]